MRVDAFKLALNRSITVKSTGSKRERKKRLERLDGWLRQQFSEPDEHLIGRRLNSPVLWMMVMRVVTQDEKYGETVSSSELNCHDPSEIFRNWRIYVCFRLIRDNCTHACTLQFHQRCVTTTLKPLVGLPGCSIPAMSVSSTCAAVYVNNGVLIRS